MRNLLVNAIDKQPLLPKIITVVPDDDIARYVRKRARDMNDNTTIEENMERVVSWLMREYQRIIEAYKADKLQEKSKKPHYPYFIWIQAPLHVEFPNNHLREKFNKAMLTASLKFNDVCILEMKKIWDPENRNYYIGKSDRFTTEGLHVYWESIDRTICYADTTILK